MKLDLLVRLLEWRIELDHEWVLKPGNLGCHRKKRLPPDLWAELALTYSGPNIEKNWAALFKTCALFRRVASEVGAALGYEYPHGLDREVSAYLQGIRDLEK